ncbi:MAG: hypothetical protein F7C32_02150 [Desulfurococcales archaeon]|nr:hypothetical protein [Desulfurococcales archaeon]
MEKGNSTEIFEPLLFELLKKIDQFTERRVGEVRDTPVERCQSIDSTKDIEEKFSSTMEMLKGLLERNGDVQELLEARFSRLESKLDVIEHKLEAIIWAIKQLMINYSLDNIAQPAYLPDQARHD